MWSVYCMQVTEVLAAKWVRMIQDCKRNCSHYCLPSQAKLMKLPLSSQQHWQRITQMYGENTESPMASPTSSRMSSPEPADQKPQRSPRDAPGVSLPPAPALPPAAIPHEPTPKTCSSLDIDLIRLLSIQGLSDEEDSPREAGANPFFSPLQPTSPRASQPMSPSALLAEADAYCGSLPSAKNYKDAHEEIAQTPGLHIASELTTPNFKPKQPAQRRKMKTSAASPHRTPKRSKTAPAAGASTEKAPKAPHAPHDIVSPLEYAVLRSAHTHNPRTYMQGKTSAAGKLFLICEVTAKQSDDHKEIMDTVAYACVINELW